MTFEESWPEIAKRLTRLLAARRVPECQRDDIIQETGIRLFRAWPRLDPDQGPWGLARAIAIHAIADGASTHSRFVPIDLPEVLEPFDTERAGIARFRLSTLRRALSEMSPTDQRVLLAEVGAAPPPRLGRSAMKMARFRARQRLRILVEKAGSWSGVQHLRLRIRVHNGRRPVHERAAVNQQFYEGAMAAVVALVTTVSGLNAETDVGSLPSRADRVGGIQGLSSATTGMDLPRLRMARHAPSASMSRSHAATEWKDADLDPDSDKHWLRDDPLYARETADQVGHDARQLRKDAEQAQKDAEQMGEDAKQLGEDGQQLAEDLPP